MNSCSSRVLPTTASRACCRGDRVLVLVVALNPSDAVLVAAFRRTIEGLVGAVEDVEPAGVAGVGVVDDAVAEGECAEAGVLGTERLFREVVRGQIRPPGAGSLHLRLRGACVEVADGDVEVVVEVASGRG